MSPTTDPEFFRRALAWLKSNESFASRVRPEDRIDPEGTGVARVQGWVVHPSRAGALGFLGLCALALGAVLAMFNPPAVHAETGRSINRAGYAVTAAAAGLFVAGEITRRRSRTAAVVELRTRRASATATSIAELRRENGASQLWLVSERPIAADVLTAAAPAGIRCYVAGPRGFQRVEAASDSASNGEVVS